LSAKQVPLSWRKKHIKCYIDQSGTMTMPVFVDLHVNFSTGIDLADVWRGVQHETIFGRLVRTHSATGMLWFIAARLYHEAFQYGTLKLIMFGDVHAILHKRAKSVDWAELVAVAKKYGMQPPLYYVLAQLRALTGAEVPEAVLAQLRPDPLGVPMPNDWGDVLPKLLSRPELHTVSFTAPAERPAEVSVTEVSS
jgi:hypothetical protein